MELYQELLLRALEEGKVSVKLSGFDLDLNQMVEAQCYQMIKEIKGVLEDGSLDDPECFERIEKIVCVLEENGISCSGRHDW
jgi:hypothetical protein